MGLIYIRVLVCILQLGCVFCCKGVSWSLSCAREQFDSPSSRREVWHLPLSHLPAQVTPLASALVKLWPHGDSAPRCELAGAWIPPLSPLERFHVSFASWIHSFSCQMNGNDPVWGCIIGKCRMEPVKGTHTSCHKAKPTIRDQSKALII